MCAILAGSALYAVSAEQEPDPSSLFGEVSLPVATTSVVAPSVPVVQKTETRPGWKTFTSTRYKFSIEFPSNMQNADYQEDTGVGTIVFQDNAVPEGFQIYIQPYTGEKITDAQFKRDVPSGVRRDARNATVGGAPAVAFYSSDQMLGDTYEVWIIRGGYLYEITTLKPLESRLNDILSTLRFN